jgi:hypothetical protein
MVAHLGIIGKPVKIRYGPAAVTGNESRCMPLFIFKWMGRRG